MKPRMIISQMVAAITTGWSNILCRNAFDGLKIFPLVTLLIGGFMIFSSTSLPKTNHLPYFFYNGESLLPQVC